MSRCCWLWGLGFMQGGGMFFQGKLLEDRCVAVQVLQAAMSFITKPCVILTAVKETIYYVLCDAGGRPLPSGGSGTLDYWVNEKCSEIY